MPLASRIEHTGDVSSAFVFDDRNRRGGSLAACGNHTGYCECSCSLGVGKCNNYGRPAEAHGAEAGTSKALIQASLASDSGSAQNCRDMPAATLVKRGSRA